MRQITWTHRLHLHSALLGALAGTVTVDKYTSAVSGPLYDKAAPWSDRIAPAGDGDA